MASLQTTGPCHIHLGFLSGSGGVKNFYLGTCEEAPRVQLRPVYKDVHNDIGGEVPFDVSFMGEDALISLDLTRWNEAVYAVLAARPHHLQAGRGFHTSTGDIGALMLTEGASFVTYLTFPYAVKPAMRAAGMPAGYRFPACVSLGPDDLYPLGTRARKIHTLIRSLRAWNPKVGAFILYDHQIPALPID